MKMNIVNYEFIRLRRRIIKQSSNIVRTLETMATEVEGQDWSQCRPYSEIPGPRPIPFFGNTWRFIPFIGIFHRL